MSDQDEIEIIKEGPDWTAFIAHLASREQKRFRRNLNEGEDVQLSVPAKVTNLPWLEAIRTSVGMIWVFLGLVWVVLGVSELVHGVASKRNSSIEMTVVGVAITIFGIVVSRRVQLIVTNQRILLVSNMMPRRIRYSFPRSTSTKESFPRNVTINAERKFELELGMKRLAPTALTIFEKK